MFERRWLLFLVVLAVYLPTATYNAQSIDIWAQEIPAWMLATQGRLAISEDAYPGMPFFFEHAGSLYSDRFPGAIVFLVPAYWLADHFGMSGFSIVPGAITAAVVAALGVLVMNEVYGALLTSRRHVHVATFFTAFGTGAWSVCANAPWSHTLNFLLLSLGLWALTREKHFLAGLAFGGVALTRPHWAVALAVLGIALGLLERSVIPTLKTALGMLPGVVLLVLYNGLLFGSWGPSNGHELGGSIGANWAGFPVNVLGAIFSPTRGLLVYYPVVLVCVLALPRALPLAPVWAKAAAVAALSGMSIQLLLNRYSGGDAFWGPRLWIEPLVLLAPLLVVCAVRYSEEHRGSRMLPLTIGVGVFIHAAGAVQAPY